MKLGTKIAASQLAVGLVAMLVIFGLVMMVWVKNYELLEQNAVRDNIRRTQFIWDKEQANLVAVIGDWAPWDDLYEFAAKPDKRDFVEKNLQDASMANLRVDMAVVTDPSGKIIFAKAIDADKKQERPIPPELQQHIKPGQSFIQTINGENPLKGLIWLDNQPVLLAGQRIFKSDHSGDSPGILFFLRIIDANMIKEIADIVQAPIRIEADRAVLQKINQYDGQGNSVINPESIRAYLPMPDLYGTVAFAIVIDTPRTFFVIAQEQARSFGSLILGLTIAMILLSTAGLHFLLGRRLQRIDTFLKELDFTGYQTPALDISGNDELAQLAISMNRMLERIAVSRRELDRANLALKAELLERERTESVLKYSSEHDALTGLNNRTYFEAALLQFKKTGAMGVGVICCDLDGLKLINDTLGHAVGDIMLKRTALILRQVLPKSALIARVGGDEFVVVLTDITPEQLQWICQRIQGYNAAEMSGNVEFPLQISTGSGYRENCPSGSNDFDQLLKEADDEMYRQKLSSSQSARNVVLQTIMKMLEIRDFVTEGHSQRMGDLATALADRIGLPPSKRNDIQLLAQFHDVGKIGVPDHILLKKGPLTPDERKEIERHSEIGHRIAMVIPEFLPVADLILKHHEWWNGKGYPLGLQGESIPIENRILSIVDAFDAMTNDRPYRTAMSLGEATAELEKCKGTQFDPLLVEEFLAMLEA